MIQSFADRDTEALYNDIRVPRFEACERQARRKLLILAAAPSLSALRVPPGNRLEALSGDRQGQYSIRIDSQWRVCFRWIDGHPHDVGICDGH